MGLWYTALRRLRYWRILFDFRLYRSKWWGFMALSFDLLSVIRGGRSLEASREICYLEVWSLTPQAEIKPANDCSLHPLSLMSSSRTIFSDAVVCLAPKLTAQGALCSKWSSDMIFWHIYISSAFPPTTHPHYNPNAGTYPLTSKY